MEELGAVLDRSKTYKKSEKRIWLSSPTMYETSMRYVMEAYETNWMSTVGANIDAIEEATTVLTGRKYAVALSCGTVALHLAIKLAGERLYGRARVGHGVLEGRRVFCSDMTFDATVNPIAYEGGEAVFIDSEYDTWNMDPIALDRAFEIYPDVKIVVLAHLYGTPAKVDEIVRVVQAHGGILIEDSAESLGAMYKGKPSGAHGMYSIYSYNGNKIITGSAGGMLVTDDKADADRARKWSTQAREAAPWYEHEELGYNYRMSNVIAGVVRDQMGYLDRHIGQKREIYERYKEGLASVPIKMNPFDEDASSPNYWLSCMTIDEEAMCPQVRSDRQALYVPEAGRSCPSEILEALASINAEGRPIWKPMHAQPIYRMHGYVNRYGDGRADSNAYIESADTADGKKADVGMDVFARGLCLPSDNKMTLEEQEAVMEVVRACFG